MSSMQPPSCIMVIIIPIIAIMSPLGPDAFFPDFMALDCMPRIICMPWSITSRYSFIRAYRSSGVFAATIF